MPNVPQMPTIPTPTQGNDDSRFQALLALKMAVEHLMGTRGGNPVSRTFVQNDPPQAYNVGDKWIVKDTGKLSYWDGSRWLPTT